MTRIYTDGSCERNPGGGWAAPTNPPPRKVEMEYIRG